MKANRAATVGAIGLPFRRRYPAIASDTFTRNARAARTLAKARGYFAHHHERLIVTANGSADPVIRPREAGSYGDATKFCGSYILADLRSRGVR